MRPDRPPHQLNQNLCEWNPGISISDSANSNVQPALVSAALEYICPTFHLNPCLQICYTRVYLQARLQLISRLTMLIGCYGLNVCLPQIYTEP